MTDSVNEFKIDLRGAGVDNDGTSYSTGTKGISAYGNHMTIDIRSKRFVINMDIASDLIDDSPEGHTSEEAFGISVDTGTKLTIGGNTTTDITIREGLGTAYGLYVGYGAEATIEGNAVIDVRARDDAYAVLANGEDIYSDDAQKPVADVTVTLSGSRNSLTGTVAAINKGNLSFETGDTTVTGDVYVDDTSALKLDDASVELAEGGTMAVEGTVTSSNGRIVLNDAAADTVSIAELASGSTLETVASGSLNDRLGGDLDAFSEAVSITNGAENTTLVMEEGLIAGEKTAKLQADGTIDASTVTEKTNSVLESSLELASALPLTMNRILTNDVRKRMGDLRASQGAGGAWVRYDGGRLSGEHGIESDFHTVQLGVDTVAAPDAPRLGVAFAYTDGDMDGARSTADIEAWSLAGYATWMSENGAFVDAVVRMSKFDNDLTVDSRLKDGLESVAIGASVEAGHRFDLSRMVYVEPQAEVAYTRIQGDDFRLSTARYEIDDLNSLTGRLGFASGLKCPNGMGDVYVRASVVHEFMGDRSITGSVTGSAVTYEVDGSDTWVEYGLGANLSLTDTTYVWADLERTSGSDLDEDIRATVGIRHAF